MKKSLKLKNPIMINNEPVSELTYDTNEITAVLFAEAEARQRKAAGTAVATPVAEAAFSLHLYLGFAAVISVNPQYDFTDLERIHGVDALELMGVGRNFILKLEKSEEGGSDKQSETIPEPSTPQSENSNEEG